jgi:hypothetical protein
MIQTVTLVLLSFLPRNVSYKNSRPYVGHCILSGVKHIFNVDLHDVSGVVYNQFILFYFKINGDGWDSTQDICHNRLLSYLLHHRECLQMSFLNLRKLFYFLSCKV